MITEDYCSYEVAKLLKEKGFDTFKSYGWDEQLFDKEHPRNFSIGFDNKEHWISCPTQSMAMKWLREVHNIFIVIEPHMYDYINEKTSSYVTSLWQGDNYHENITSKDYPTYEEAVDATIKYCLENLI